MGGWVPCANIDVCLARVPSRSPTMLVGLDQPRLEARYGPQPQKSQGQPLLVVAVLKYTTTREHQTKFPTPWNWILDC